MAIVINGTGTVTGISVGGLPDAIVDLDTLAADSVNAAKIVDGTIVVGDIADDAVTADKLANSINTDIATGVTAGTTASAALPKAGGAMTGAITTNSTFDGVDIAVRDAILTSTTTTADAALPKAGGTITGAVYHGTNNFGNDSGDFMNWTTNTRLDITVHSNNEFRFEADGDFHADGDVIAYSTTTASDRKLKDNITTIEDALDKVKQLNGVEFTWKKDGKKSAGVIAQDVEKVLPQAVKTVNDLNTDEEYKTVKYDALTSILIESIKELSARVEELENK